MTHAFERNLAYQKQKELILKPDFKTLYPFLQVLPKEEYINAILREINQLAKFSDGYSTSMTNLYITLGKYIYKKYQVYSTKFCFILSFVYYCYLVIAHFMYINFISLYSNTFYLNCVQEKNVPKYCIIKLI